VVHRNHMPQWKGQSGHFGLVAQSAHNPRYVKLGNDAPSRTQRDPCRSRGPPLLFEHLRVDVKSALVEIEYAIFPAQFEPNSAASAVEIFVVSCASEHVPPESGPLPKVDPRLQVHEELTGAVRAGEVLDPLKVEAISRKAGHLA